MLENAGKNTETHRILAIIVRGKRAEGRDRQRTRQPFGKQKDDTRMPEAEKRIATTSRKDDERENERRRVSARIGGSGKETNKSYNTRSQPPGEKKNRDLAWCSASNKGG